MCAVENIETDEQNNEQKKGRKVVNILVLLFYIMRNEWAL